MAGMRAGLPPLRFKVGDRVEANCGKWMAGTVIKLYYTESRWGPGEWKPYQILLDDNKGLVFAPFDDDAVVRRASPASPIFEFVDAGDVAGVQELLLSDLGDEAVRHPDRKGFHPLSYALSPERDLDVDARFMIVRCILECGADVNARCGKSRTTALHQAISLGDAELVKLLLSQPKIKLNVQDLDTADFRDPSQWILVEGDSRYLSPEEKQKAMKTVSPLNDTPLLLALKEENEELADLLINAKSDVNIRDVDGASPLLLALEEGMIGTASRLVSSGADTKVTSNDMVAGTPIHHFASRGNVPALKLLLADCGPGEINALAGSAKTTALHLAARSGKLEVCKLLLQSGADHTVLDANGATVADVARKSKRQTVAEYFDGL